MPQTFEIGDDLVFQLESGYGLLRVLAKQGENFNTVWHLLAYEELFPSVEAAEEAVARGSLRVRNAHFAVTDRAFERTPAAKLGNRSISEEELTAYKNWLASTDRVVHDRSALLILGLR
jgi:hypothetical protein